MDTIYCWKCKENVPLLEGEKAHQFLIQHRKSIEAIKQYRQDTGAPLNETPREEIVKPTYALYENLTGIKPKPNTFDHLREHTPEFFGPECNSCGKPLRSPTAKICASCWAKV